MSPIIIWADNWYPTIGGLEKALHLTALSLIKSGLPVVVLTKKDGIDRTKVGYEILEFTDQNFFSSFVSLAKKTRGTKKSIIYCSRLFINNELKQFDSLASIKDFSIVVLRIPSTWNRKRYSQVLFNTRIKSLIDHFICLNSYTCKILSKRFPKGSVWLVNNYCSNGQLKDVSHNRHDIMWAGRLVPSKNIKNLVKSWDLIRDKLIDNQNLILFTNLNCNEYYQNEVISLANKTKNIIMANGFNFLSHSPVVNFKFTILPSFREGCSNLLVESFSKAIPVIGTDIPGIREHISNGRGILIKRPFDSNSISNAILEAFSIEDNDYFEMQKTINLYFNSFFSREQVAPILRNLLECQ